MSIVRSSFSQRGRRAAVVAVAVSALCALMAGPAAAVGEAGHAAGAGAEVVNTDPPSGLPTCLHVTDSSYSIPLVGIVTGGGGTSAYLAQPGGLTIELDSTNYYLNAAGVFSDAACTSPGVPVTMTLSGSGGGGSVS